MCDCGYDEERFAKLEAEVQRIGQEQLAEMRAYVERFQPISAERVLKLTNAYRESLDDYTKMTVELQLEKKKIADTVHALKGEISTLQQQVMLMTHQQGGQQFQQALANINDLGARIRDLEMAGGGAHD